MMSDDFKVFEDKTFSELMHDIYNRSENKKNKIETIVDSLKDLIVTIEDAVSILPMIKECLDVGVKNDEQLVKMAAVIQRLVTSKKMSNNDDDFGFDSGELEELKKSAATETKNLRQTDAKVGEDIKEMEESVEEKLKQFDDIDIEDLENELTKEDLENELKQDDSEL